MYGGHWLTVLLLSGNYSDGGSLGIMRHLLKYLGEYYASHSSLPCSLLILQDLKPELVQKLRMEDLNTMRRCGADDIATQLKIALSDILFVESDANEAGARIFERLWNEGSSESEEYEMPRAVRRLKAELVANDKACRRLATVKNTSSNPPPKLFTIGPTLHTTSDDHVQSPLSPLSMRSPLSRFQSDSTRQDRSSHSGSSTSLNTLGDSDPCATHEVHISEALDLEESAPNSSELQIKPLPPVASGRSSPKTEWRGSLQQPRAP